MNIPVKMLISNVFNGSHLLIQTPYSRQWNCYNCYKLYFSVIQFPAMIQWVYVVNATSFDCYVAQITL